MNDDPLIWFTNDYSNMKHEYELDGCTVGPPRANAHYSEKQLADRNICGFYWRRSRVYSEMASRRLRGEKLSKVAMWAITDEYRLQ